MHGDDELSTFQAERPRLRSIAYRMLGTPDDADDVLQDAWLRWHAADHDTISNPPGWLTTVTTRLAIDRLRSAHHTRETYVGPWLAAPIEAELVSADEPVESVLFAESLTLGFLAVLERLSPLERAVFLLHDVFAYPLAEVALVIERSDEATRQLAKRARDHIEQKRPRFAPDPADAEALTMLMLGAAMNGDIETLESYLAADVVHLSDGGADRRAARHPVIGPHRVARLFVGLAKRFLDGGEFHHVRANGQDAMYVTVNGEPEFLHVSNWVDGKLAGSFAVRNPDKLAAFHQQWLASD